MRDELRNLAYRAGDAFGQTWLTPPRTVGGRFVHNGPRDARRVALTFDDGPSIGSTDRLLDTLGELGVPATFFCVGENVRLNPELVQREQAEGHAVGNHSIRHERGPGLGFSGTAHVTDAEDELVEVLGGRPTLYRPPWGWLTSWEARRLHGLDYTILGWDVYTLDWQIPPPSPTTLAEAVVDDVQPGSVVCMHDAFPLAKHYEKTATAEAVRLLVPRLRDLGYEFVTVPDLLDQPSLVEARHAA